MGLFGKKREEPDGFVWHDDGLPEGIDETLFLAGDGWEVLCAWCLVEQGMQPLGGSHGICERHAAEVYQTPRSRRR